jgi:hypothetical protein
MDESHSPAGERGTGHGVRIVLKALLVVPAVALTLAAPAQAGLFKKSPKPDPAVHVPALIETLKSDKDEKARAAAAADLDEYDAKAFPDILPALMDALANDPSTSVRSRAAESIGKIRPITAAAGYALERAASDDKSFGVRVSARTALLKYKVLGHLPGTRIEGGLAQSAEPPLATGPVVKDLSSGTVLRPTPPPVPTDGPVPAPALSSPSPKPPPDGPSAAPKPAETQTDEPPLAASPSTAPPALTGTPKAPAPVIVIPPAPPGDAVAPVPPVAPPSSGPTLPPPKG